MVIIKRDKLGGLHLVCDLLLSCSVLFLLLFCQPEPICQCLAFEQGWEVLRHDVIQPAIGLAAYFELCEPLHHDPTTEQLGDAYVC